MSASKDTLSCPVCKLDGFVIAELPQTCPQCGWRVELLIGQISEAYRAKLAAAREEWQAGGGALGRAKRLAGLFDKAADHWRAGRWAEALGVYDEILKLNPVNARAARERPAALFCLMESLFLDFARSQRDQLRQANERDQAERDKRRAEAAQFESVGMRKEAQEVSRKAETLELAITQREAEARTLTECISGWYAGQWQNSGPESLPTNDDISFHKLRILPDPSWRTPAFERHILVPFMEQSASNLSGDLHAYVTEFSTSWECENVRESQANQARERKAQDVLNERQRRERIAATIQRRAARRQRILHILPFAAMTLLIAGVVWAIAALWPQTIQPALANGWQTLAPRLWILALSGSLAGGLLLAWGYCTNNNAAEFRGLIFSGIFFVLVLLCAWTVATPIQSAFLVIWAGLLPFLIGSMASSVLGRIERFALCAVGLGLCGVGVFRLTSTVASAPFRIVSLVMIGMSIIMMVLSNTAQWIWLGISLVCLGIIVTLIDILVSGIGPTGVESRPGINALVCILFVISIISVLCAKSKSRL